MTDKELHKLKRAQLLDLMLAQSQEIERLEKNLGNTNKNKIQKTFWRLRHFLHWSS